MPWASGLSPATWRQLWRSVRAKFRRARYDSADGCSVHVGRPRFRPLPVPGPEPGLPAYPVDLHDPVPGDLDATVPRASQFSSPQHPPRPGCCLHYAQLPFAVFVMRNAFRQVPKEIEESAIVDGAGTGSLLRLMLPLAVPGIMTVCIYTFLFAWTESLAPLTFLTSQSLFTLPIALLNIENGTFGQVNYAVLEAGAVLSMVPSVVVYLALQRYCVAGFLSGSVKG